MWGFFFILTFLKVPNIATVISTYLSKTLPTYTLSDCTLGSPPQLPAYLSKAASCMVQIIRTQCIYFFERTSPLGFHYVLLWNFTQIRKKRTFCIMICFSVQKSKYEEMGLHFIGFCFLVFVSLIMLPYFGLLK